MSSIGEKYRKSIKIRLKNCQNSKNVNGEIYYNKIKVLKQILFFFEKKILEKMLNIFEKG